MSRNARALLIIVPLMCLSASVSAQSPAPPHVPLQKTIGQARQEIVPSLIVMNARSASLQGGTLTLTGVAPSSIVFADRPVRAAGHSLTSTLLEEWSPANTSDESFAKDPPNATISVFSSDGSKVQDAVVVLKSPVLEGDRLTFAVDVLEGGPITGDGPAAVFIDRFGFGGFGGFHGGYGGFHAVTAASTRVRRRRLRPRRVRPRRRSRCLEPTRMSIAAPGIAVPILARRR